MLFAIIKGIGRRCFESSQELIYFAAYFAALPLAWLAFMALWCALVSIWFFFWGQPETVLLLWKTALGRFGSWW